MTRPTDPPMFLFGSRSLDAHPGTYLPTCLLPSTAETFDPASKATGSASLSLLGEVRQAIRESQRRMGQGLPWPS